MRALSQSSKFVSVQRSGLFVFPSFLLSFILVVVGGLRTRAVVDTLYECQVRLAGTLKILGTGSVNGIGLMGCEVPYTAGDLARGITL